MLILSSLSMIWSKILQIFSMINFPVDILDIALVAFIIYQLFQLPKSQTAVQILKAIVILLIVSILSNIIGLNMINYLIDKIIEVGLIALVIVFQPELRKILERVGSSSIRNIVAPKGQRLKPGERDNMIKQIVDACRTMSRSKTGVLIVFQRKNNLDGFFKSGGTKVDAEISAELLKNIFFPKASLHDGAVIIRDGRLAAAGCVLPLTEKDDLNHELGTRHRAAIGITENTDAFAVVVSEETGVISYAENGKLKRYLTPESLTRLLKEELAEEVEPGSQHGFWAFVTKITEKLSRKADKNEDSNHDKT